MTRLYASFLSTVAIVVLLIAGISNAAASPALALGRRSDAQFFSGSGSAFYGPFSLVGGRYSVDIWAQDNPVVDPNDDGCIFGAYIDGVEIPMHLTLSTPLRVSFPAWHYNPLVTFPAGHYKLFVLPGSDCDWRVSILPLGPTAPSIAVVAARAYLHHGTTFTPTTLVHMGQTIDFAIFFRLDGIGSGTPAGTLTISEHGRKRWSFRLQPWTDTDGTQQLYINLIFSRKAGATPGPAVATFTITAGTLHARQTLSFTVAS